MPEDIKDQLNVFVEKHLEKIQQKANNPSRELRVLKTVLNPEKLSLDEFMVLSEVGDSALDLRGANNTTPRPRTPYNKVWSPTGVDFDFDAQSDYNRESPTFIEQKVDERVNILEERGVSPAPLPEVNSRTIGGFISNATDYITRTIALPTVTEILAARKDSKNARTFAQIPNVMADEVFEVISGGGDIAKMPRNAVNRMIWGTGTTIAANMVTHISGATSDKPTKLASRAIAQGTGIQGGVITSVSTYVGEKLGLSKDDADNLGNVVIGTMKTGSLSSGLANASEKLLYKEAWKRSGGSDQLSEIRSVGEAKDKFFVSKELANTAMTYFSNATEMVAEVAGQSMINADPFGMASFLTKEGVKLGAQGLLLGSVVALKNYFSTDKVQAQNPELIADTVANLSAEEGRIRRENPELNTPVRENIREEQELDHEVGEITSKQWKDIPAIPRAIRGDTDLLKQARKAAAPAVRVITAPNKKDSMKIPTATSMKQSSQRRK